MESSARDRRIMREKIRRKKQMERRRKMIRTGVYAAGAVLVTVFLVKGVFLPLVNKMGGDEEMSMVQANVIERDPDAAIRQPL